MSLTADPRWIEHRDAYADVSKGLSAPTGAHERYRHSQLPYVELLAEHCENSLVRKHMMRALFGGGMSLGVILVGFKATKAEREFLENAPVTAPEPVDEIDRLARLPYGAYLKTSHWQRVRKEALKRAEHRCTLCNTANGLEVHHRSYKRRGCERPADVVVLCDSCHGRHHGAMRAA